MQRAGKRRAGLALVLALAAAGAAAADGGAAADIVALVNRFRADQGLAAVKPEPRLAAAAELFAAYMARSGRYAHDADGRQPAQRAEAAGYDFCIVTENIAYFSSTEPSAAAALARQFVEGWERSPGHRRNMADSDVVDTGVAVAQSAQSGRWYAVQMFGRPRALHQRFTVENRAAVALGYELDGRRYELPPGVTRTHEQCRAAKLAMRLPGEREPVVVEPAHGQRWRIDAVGRRLRLVLQR
jgi:hypothetical protein